MKLLTAIMKRFKLDDLQAALSSIGLIGMTVREVEVLVQAARSGRVADDKIFVTLLERGVPIRTGGADAEALGLPSAAEHAYRRAWQRLGARRFSAMGLRVSIRPD
ncbi:MAG: P-II family nitrogen regulator [Gammaproteobacteria bacterium]